MIAFLLHSKKSRLNRNPGVADVNRLTDEQRDFVEATGWLVGKWVVRFCRDNSLRADLCQVGCLALVEAVARYEEFARTTDIMPYLSNRIKGAIIRALYDLPLVRIPRTTIGDWKQRGVQWTRPQMLGQEFLSDVSRDLRLNVMGPLKIKKKLNRKQWRLVGSSPP